MQKSKICYVHPFVTVVAYQPETPLVSHSQSVRNIDTETGYFDAKQLSLHFDEEELPHTNDVLWDEDETTDE